MENQVIQNDTLHSPEQCKANLMAVADALYAIGGKWKLQIIVALMPGSKRFNELQRLLNGISAKVLSAELKELEMNGFIKRKVFTGTPVTIDYEISEYACTLGDVLKALGNWGAMHRENIKHGMNNQMQSTS